jgi:hypothetical protein
VDLEDEVCHPQGGTTCLRGHVPARRCDPSLVSNRRHARPAFVPRATGRRQETSETARATNLQVRNRIRVSPQVAKPGSRTLSRWRHGFEPRWDYEQKGPGQGTSMKAFGGLNRDSNAEYPENIPSCIERSEVRKSPRVEGGCTDATASWHPHHCAVHGRTNGHRIGTSWSSVPRPSRSLRRRPARSVCPLSAQGRGGQGGRRVVLVRSDRRVRGAGQRGPNREALVDGLSFRSIGR